MSQKAEIKKQKRYAATQRSMSKKFYNHETAQAKSKPRCKTWTEADLEAVRKELMR